MEFNAKHIALFDAYLLNEVSDEERTNFESKLVADKNFKSEFEAFKLLQQDMADSEVITFKDQLEQWDKKISERPQNKTTRIIPLKLIGLAASILLIIVISVLYFIDTPNHQALVATNFEPYDNILTVRGEKEDLDEGMMYYESGDYKTAITLFENYPENTNAQFYKGEAHLAVNEYDAAINSFELVITAHSIFNEIAEYHLALAYIGREDINVAKAHLKAIAADSDFYSKAQSLLDELE